MTCPSDLVYLMPAQDSLGGVAHAPSHPNARVWYDVAVDTRNCPFCNEEIGDNHCIAIMPDREWRIAHPLCAVSAKGGKTDMAIGAPWKLEHSRARPDCARCHAPFLDHGIATGTGRLCADGESYVAAQAEAA